MSNSIRWVVRGVQGRVRANFSWPGVITNTSVVHITAGEVKFGGTIREPSPPFQDFYYVLGDADVWISNISPHHNTFRNDDPGGCTIYFTRRLGQPAGCSYYYHS